MFFNKNKNNIAFKNNLKCSQYIEQENKKINEIANLSINEKSIVSAPRIFYSPKLNTCVSAYSIVSLDNENGFSGYYINDLLTNDSLYQEGSENKGTIDEVPLSQILREKYNKKIKELE